MAFSSNSGDEEDDPVVHEIDMCLAKALAERLYLFQYPVRPASFSYDHTPHLAARMKPKQQKVELELGMNIGASTYCFPRGEQIARAVDQGVEGTKQKPFFQGPVMDRHVLTSTRAAEDSTKYAAAVYSKGVLHITPLKGIIQLRPGFNYFDKAEENQKKAAAAHKADHDESQEEDEPELKPVQMRFAKNPTQSKGKPSTVNQQAEEEWIEMQFHQPQDRRSLMERNLLYCHQTDFDAPEFTVTSRDYLKMLSPPTEEDSSIPAAMPHGILSLLKLKTMHFTDQVKALLITAKVLQFTQLCVLLGGGLEEKVVLKALEQYALLVQGCWVVKSEILYPKGSKSQISGIDAEKIWPTRDYVMFCFNRKRVISRKEVSSVSRLPTEELREVLEQMARQRPAQGWEFTLSTDNDFLQRHSEVSTSQLATWKQKYKNMMEQLHITEDFFNEEFKETDFPGVFPQLQRKPNTPRRRVTVDSPDKGKNKPARRRSRSQSSQEGDTQQPTRRKPQSSDVEMMLVKEEPDSPVRKSTITADKNSKNQKTKNNKNGVSDFTREEPKASKNITKILMEVDNLDKSDNDDNQVNSTLSTKTKRRKVLAIDSDGEEDSIVEPKEEEMIRVTEKPGNEVEVDAIDSTGQKHGIQEDSSNNSDDIFVPPIASRLKKEVLDKVKPPSEIFVKELKKFIRNSIRSCCVSFADLKEFLNTKQKEPGSILCTGVDDDLLLKCVLETGAVQVPIDWGENCNVPIDRQRVFLYRTLNEATDKFRTVVVDMFIGKMCVRKKDIMERLEMVVGEVPSYHIYSKFMSEFCENHGAQWYLHGTFQSLQKYQPAKT